MTVTPVGRNVPVTLHHDVVGIVAADPLEDAAVTVVEVPILRLTNRNVLLGEEVHRASRAIRIFHDGNLGTVVER